ncbi:hypothetical protein [Chlamydia vaughanii]|uniref:hypothetical protein n=1 Tax=Chlamydia vaughanii TaxID=3112552 RepID=UPI0032B12E0E
MCAQPSTSGFRNSRSYTIVASILFVVLGVPSLAGAARSPSPPYGGVLLLLSPWGSPR